MIIYKKAKVLTLIPVIVFALTAIIADPMIISYLLVYSK